MEFIVKGMLTSVGMLCAFAPWILGAKGAFIDAGDFLGFLLMSWALAISALCGACAMSERNETR